jgi:uncharacterized protein (UPF0332 family)
MDAWARVDRALFMEHTPFICARYDLVMSEQNGSVIYIVKAEESLSGAESEYANRRFQNCANRAYYVCYQAAVAGLLNAGIRPSGSRWGHDTVQAQFVGELINRRKRYPAELRDTFERLFLIRQTADYAADFVSEIQAAGSVRRARTFVAAVRDA